MDQQLLCWGLGTAGQLGNGSFGGTLTPTLEFDAVHTWKTVSASRASADGHTCAIRQGGRLYCWGSNVFGELGTGAPPQPVPPAE
jgi:alpha-tubulin suppressor-like RCC1 family protein